MSNSNKKYEDMAEHTKNNRPEKKPKMDATTIATGKRLLKYVMDSYKYRFILVFICILLSAVASISVSLSLKYLLDDFIIPLIGQKSPNYTELYRALTVLGCIFLVGVIATFTYTRMMVYIGQGVLKKVRDDMFEHMQTLPIRYFDQNTGRQVMELFHDINSEGHTIIMITHDAKIASHASRIVRILDGNLEDGDLTDA